MPAALPVVVQVVAAPAPSEDQLRALLESCSGAVGAGGCAPAEADPGEARARVVVRFDGDLVRVHVEIVAAASDGTASARDADFRATDPSLDRYRAAGLLAADLVVDRERQPHAEPEASPPPLLPLNPPPLSAPSPTTAPATPAPPPTAAPPAALSDDEPPRPPIAAAYVAGRAMVATTGDQAWWAAALAADVGPSRSPFFATVSVLYGATWTSNAAGVSEQRFAAAAGAGARASISGPVSLRIRGGVQLNDLRASVVQPGTRRTDAGGRWLAGVGADAAIVFPLAGPVDLEVGASAAWLGDSTVVRVQGQPAATISAWAEGVSLGLGARFH